MQFNLVRRSGDANITVIIDGDLYVADDQHPNFEKIVEAVLAEASDADVLALIDASVEAAKKFENLSERVSVANGRVYVDGDEVGGAFADQIVRFLEDDLDDWQPLVNFLEKVFTNTETHTRENLDRWLNATGGFTIADNGNIIGYKGLTSEGGSVHRGPAIVDGEAVNGSVPNKPGSVVEMARSAVEHNPRVACASGLHVGTWDYASSFGHGVTAEVEVNPRDVVSVPTDCNGQKMRVARYTVVRYLSDPYTEAVVPSGVEFSEDYIEGYDDGFADAEVGEPYKF